MKRRGFFKRLAAVVAVVALAPEIAFRSKLEMPTAEIIPFWIETTRVSYCYSQEYRDYLAKCFDEVALFKHERQTKIP